MNIRIFSIVFALIPCIALGAARQGVRDGGRVGVRRAPMAVGMTAGQKERCCIQNHNKYCGD